MEMIPCLSCTRFISAITPALLVFALSLLVDIREDAAPKQRRTSRSCFVICHDLSLRGLLTPHMKQACVEAGHVPSCPPQAGSYGHLGTDRMPYFMDRKCWGLPCRRHVQAISSIVHAGSDSPPSTYLVLP